MKLFGDIAVDWSICEQPYDQILQANLESKGIYSQQAYAWKSWLKRFWKKEVKDCPTILFIEGKTGSGRSSFLASIRKTGPILAPDLAFSAIVSFSELDEDDLKSRLQLLKQLNHLPSDSHSKNGIQKKAYHYVRSWQPIIQELSENFTLEERE